jgi:hypothetical protein
MSQRTLTKVNVVGSNRHAPLTTAHKQMSEMIEAGPSGPTNTCDMVGAGTVEKTDDTDGD